MKLGFDWCRGSEKIFEYIYYKKKKKKKKKNMYVALSNGQRRLCKTVLLKQMSICLLSAWFPH